MLGSTRRHTGEYLWWGLLLFFSGLLVWGLFWGVPEVSDVTTNFPVAYIIGRVADKPYANALAFTYLVMGWACVGIGVVGVATVVGWRRTKREFRRGIGKARDMQPFRLPGKRRGWW